LRKHESLVLCVGLFVAIGTLEAQALSIQVLEPSPPFFDDINGNRLESVKAGEQVMITTTFQNYLEEEVDFVGLLEVRDIDGVTVFLAWQLGKVEPLGDKTIGASWLVPETSAYQSRTFAITNFEQPQVLSPVESAEIEPPCIQTGSFCRTIIYPKNN
jgi:hypothetical protein